MHTPTQKKFTASVTIKVTPKIKKWLYRKASEEEQSMCRIVRRAIQKTYPESKKETNGS